VKLVAVAGGLYGIDVTAKLRDPGRRSRTVRLGSFVEDPVGPFFSSLAAVEDEGIDGAGDESGAARRG
jgi:hypothetical protein